MFFIDKNDKDNHHIFFDDNIWPENFRKEENLIVDVRDMEGNVLNPMDYIDKYLVKVEPLKAIKDKNYFINCIQKCEKNVL